MIRVNSLSPTEMIPKAELLSMLEKEAPDFIASVLSLELPPAPGRLGIPVISTLDKQSVQESNRNPVEVFIDDKIFNVPGKMLKYGDLWEMFQADLKAGENQQWTQQRFGREFGLRFPKGRNPKDGSWNFGNVSFEPLQDGEPPAPKLIIEVRGGNSFLIPEK